MPAPYRADHVGSLLRPASLLDARRARVDGRLSLEEVRKLEDAAILDVLAMQKKVGIDVYTDGEIRRGGWWGDFSTAVEGYVPSTAPIALQWKLADGATQTRTAAFSEHAGTAARTIEIPATIEPADLAQRLGVTTDEVARALAGNGVATTGTLNFDNAAAAGNALGFEVKPLASHVVPQISAVIGKKLHQKQRLMEHEIGFLKEHAPGPFKVTIPSTSYVVARGWKPGVSEAAYATRLELQADVSAIMRKEILAAAADGASYVQIDNPHFPDYIPEDRRAQLRSIGVDPDKALEEDIAGDNAAVAGLDRTNVVLGTHLCRGNNRSAWHTEGGYDAIAEQLFSTLDTDRYLLEYDDARSGGFEPLRFMPKGKIVVLGLVTSKLGEPEPQDLLLRRIEEASKYVPLEYLALSPQCGFASVEGGNLLSEDQQWRKLELVAETARKVWG